MNSVLNVYSEVNGIDYVQGMNEILGLVVFVVRGEEESFWCFNSIMTQLKDLFIPDADSTHAGIYSNIEAVYELVRCYDCTLYRYIEKHQLPLAALIMRWMTTLLATDLTLADSIRIWDVALMSAPGNHLLNFSIHLCAAYLLEMGQQLAHTDDPQECVEFASSYGMSADVDIGRLITRAVSIHVFEIHIRSKYNPNSDEPILELLGEAFQTTKERVKDMIGKTDGNMIKEALLEKATSAGSTVTDWFGKITSHLPRM